MSSITGATAVAGIIGRPVRHSMSPILHNAWLAAAAIDGVYVPFSPTPEGLPALITGFRGGAIRGLNVTIPFKEAALAAADIASERAKRAGAANVLVFAEDGTIYADNTDGVGLIGALEFVADKTTKAMPSPVGSYGARIAELCHEEGLIIRNIGDVIAFCPPLIITEAQIEDMFGRFGRALARFEA